jgi:hypothetical protein
MSPDKRHLFAVNTPDNRLEIFRIREDGLIHTASIPVGATQALIQRLRRIAARSNNNAEREQLLAAIQQLKKRGP